jgi:CubicO group peptidase (beta-lactamase class C family)
MPRTSSRPALSFALKGLPAILLIAHLLLPNVAVAQTGRIAPEKRAHLQAAISRFMAANSIPGVSVAVVENGAEEWSAGFGTADLENSVPATSHTLYRLASISKSITATAALLQWQQGKLDLDAPIQKYCPSFPQKDAPITTRELLGHLGEFAITNPVRKTTPKPATRNTSQTQSRVGSISSRTIRWLPSPAPSSTIPPRDSHWWVAPSKAPREKTTWITFARMC